MKLKLTYDAGHNDSDSIPHDVEIVLLSAADDDCFVTMIIKNTDNGYGESKKLISQLLIKAVLYEQSTNNQQSCHQCGGSYISYHHFTRSSPCSNIKNTSTKRVRVVVVVVLLSVLGDVAGEM